MMIITDSASDITKQEALEMNIRIVSLKIRFSDGEFHQNTEEDFSVFFENLQRKKIFRLRVSHLRKNFWSFTKKRKMQEKKYW